MLEWLSVEELKACASKCEKEAKGDQFILEQRTTELRKIEPLFNPAGRSKPLDVQLFGELNQDIYSFAAGIADDIQLLPQKFSSSDDSFDAVRHKRWCAVETLMLSNDTSTNRDLLQIALQHCLCHHLAIVATTFSPGIPSEFTQIFDAVQNSGVFDFN